MENQEHLDQFDDERILKGLVTPQEKKDLGAKLIKMYLERARSRGRTVVVLRNREEYEKLRQSGKLFFGKNFYLLIEGNPEQVLDMTPVVYHLLDTEEGLFYGMLSCSQQISSP